MILNDDKPIVFVLDLIFILLDKPDEDNDQLISEHIMGFHDSLFRYPNDDASLSFLQSGGSKKRTFDTLYGQNSNHDFEEKNTESSQTLAQRLRKQVREVMRRDQMQRAAQNGSSYFKLSHEELRRYVEYSKKYVHPRLSKGAARVLQRMYLQMRAESSGGGKQVSDFFACF